MKIIFFFHYFIKSKNEQNHKRETKAPIKIKLMQELSFLIKQQSQGRGKRLGEQWAAQTGNNIVNLATTDPTPPAPRSIEQAEKAAEHRDMDEVVFTGGTH